MCINYDCLCILTIISVLQMTCDAKFRITNCVAKWPGSVHDARMFRTSQFCSIFENGNV